MDEKKEVKMGLTEEDVRREQDAGPAGLFRAMGDSLADADAIAASEDGRAIAERMAVMAMDEDSEQSKAYWRGYEKGLIKETHGDRADRLNRWASYVPVAYEAAPGRRFPLIFCLHGAHNPIQLAESYGVMQLAAREECIVIAPENENLDNILALLDYAKEHYPVDGSRVYSIGYSFGGFMTSRNVLARPELFAGAGMGGMLFAGDVRAHELDGQFYPEYRLTEEMLRRAEALEVPALLFMGEREMLCLEPLHREPEGDVRDGVIDLSAEAKRRAFDNWRRVGGCGASEWKPAEFYAASADPVVRSVGAEFERTEVRVERGRKYFVGDSVNDRGECLFRTVSCEGMVHWPTPSYAELAWEQIGKYARDVKTGQLIRL